MNILIVGNGFDLSHYLPTKYDHFMVAMQAIENWGESKGDMGFDDIFGKDYWFKDTKTGEEWQNKFFQYTKAIYKTDEIKFSIKQINEFQKQLKENIWYQYFSDHVREVKTWIDFENKIETALNDVCLFFDNVEDVVKNNSQFDMTITNDSKLNNMIFLNQKSSQSLEILGLLNCEYYTWNDFGEYDQCEKSDGWEQASYKLNENFVFQNQFYTSLKLDEIINYLQQSLNELIDIFNNYLLLINELSLIKKKEFSSDIDVVDIRSFEHIFSFNYTNTVCNLYIKKKVEFLHGSLSRDKRNNIVLGLSDLDINILNKYKLFGFLKYHQKLLKKTDYLFLDDSTELFQRIYQFEVSSAYNESFDFYIWGHSLDTSDREYIKELFSFDSRAYHRVNIIVLYYNLQAEFDLLANLLHILGKEKVEKWMKKGWLKFKQNPDIAKLNNIQPVELPKFERV